MLLATTVTLIPIISSDYTDPWAWGTASGNILKIGSVNSTGRGTLFNAWLSNMPQVLLSFCYLNLNTLCTSMACAEEWNTLGTTRKGLRVTKPGGQQRSTYFLQLPYKWAIPLMAISGLLHWLLSQSFFLVRFDSFDRRGTRNEEASKSACGASISSLIVFYVTALGLIIGVRWVGRRSMILMLPPADCCSAFISASCHPPSDDVDPCLEKVKWGMVNQEVIIGHGHCSISSKPVMKPQPGTVYY
jgi:hypothetical protein